MTSNQATLHKLEQMRLYGMVRALRLHLETGSLLTADERWRPAMSLVCQG